uniref:zinc finger protein 658B-like isoform X2 n=1 Tax=Myxine glutinosa TaxID=7769 RepID=UPI00358F2567
MEGRPRAQVVLFWTVGSASRMFTTLFLRKRRNQHPETRYESLPSPATIFAGRAGAVGSRTGTISGRVGEHLPFCNSLCFNGVLKVEPEALAMYTSPVNAVKEEPFLISRGTTQNSVQSENGSSCALNGQPEAFAVSTSQVCIVVKEEPLDVCENIMGTTKPADMTPAEPTQCLFCLECNESFHAATDLRLHMKTRHQDSRGKQHKCSYCFYSTGDSYKLQMHEKIHVELPYKCSLCGKAFAKLSGLKIHFTVHTRNEESYDSVYFNTKIRGKTYDCSICKRAFAHRCNLKTHERIHTGEKPYECLVCKKAFAYHHSLAAHERTHTGEKPFECSFCKKAFASSSNLPAHMRIHMNGRKDCKEEKGKL